jgi:hypothetical protein
VSLRIQKDIGFSKDEVNMGEDVSMMPKATLKEGEGRGKDDFSLKRKAGSFPRDLKSECVELDGKDRHD